MLNRVYLVVGARNCPGRIFGVFVKEKHAERFRDMYYADEADIEAHHLIRGNWDNPDHVSLIPES